MCRARIHVSGLSRGSNFGVTGWVKNGSDGSVEMEAEGEREDIRSMFETIERGTFIVIEDIEETEIPLENDRSFEVKE